VILIHSVFTDHAYIGHPLPDTLVWHPCHPDRKNHRSWRRAQRRGLSQPQHGFYQTINVRFEKPLSGI